MIQMNSQMEIRRVRSERVLITGLLSSWRWGTSLSQRGYVHPPRNFPNPMLLEFYGGSLKKVWLIINSICSPSSFSAEWGVDLKIPNYSLVFWWPVSIQEPSRSPPRVTPIRKKGASSPLITKEITKVLGILCQEQRAEINTYFLLSPTMVNQGISCYIQDLKRRWNFSLSLLW